MHIPENYLSPSTCAVMTAAMLPVWGYSINKVRTEIPKARMPLLGIGAAFSFLGMMFNVPLPGGTTGHAVGGTLIAILTGSPAAGCISVSIALLIQALLFWGWRNPCIWKQTVSIWRLYCRTWDFSCISCF